MILQAIAGAGVETGRVVWQLIGHQYRRAVAWVANIPEGLGACSVGIWQKHCCCGVVGLLVAIRRSIENLEDVVIVWDALGALVGMFTDAEDRTGRCGFPPRGRSVPRILGRHWELFVFVWHHGRNRLDGRVSSDDVTERLRCAQNSTRDRPEEEEKR